MKLSRVLVALGASAGLLTLAFVALSVHRIYLAESAEAQSREERGRWYLERMRKAEVEASSVSAEAHRRTVEAAAEAKRARADAERR